METMEFECKIITSEAYHLTIKEDNAFYVKLKSKKKKNFEKDSFYLLRLVWRL